jgi:hypothetical protein
VSSAFGMDISDISQAKTEIQQQVAEIVGETQEAINSALGENAQVVFSKKDN